MERTLINHSCNEYSKFQDYLFIEFYFLLSREMKGYYRSILVHPYDV